MTLDTYARQNRKGYLLLQERKVEVAGPNGYWSRTRTDLKKKYETTQMEYLASVCSVLIQRHYLEGTRFIFQTDRSYLKYILNVTNITVQLVRWRLSLSEDDFEIINKANINNQSAIFLSCLRTNGEYQTHLDEYLSDLAMDEKENCE